MGFSQPIRPLRVLLVGSGGREHAIAWKLRQSPLLGSLDVAPGNPGIRDLAHLVPIDAEDVTALVDHAVARGYDLVIVGPEDPLAAGLVDRLEAAGIPAVGPTAAAAQIESSKRFAKDLCEQAGIPTAASTTFTDFRAALAYTASRTLPVVLKADGLCKGKGVTIASSSAEV